MRGYKLQIASDVVRDGLGCELIDNMQEFVAEVFRCDADHTVTINGKLHGVPLAVVEWFLAEAKTRLDPFENGSPLSELPAANER